MSLTPIALCAEYLGHQAAQQALGAGVDLVTPWLETLTPEERELLDAFLDCVQRSAEHAVVEYREGRH